MAPLDSLQKTLRRLFRLEETEELDFGVHRVIGLKREALDQFLQHNLPRKIDDLLRQSREEVGEAKKTELLRARKWALDALGPDALDADGNLADAAFAKTPSGAVYLRAQQDALHLKDADQMRGEIFDHLANFFARYDCGGGDIVPRRRHAARNRYAVPHNGEEVLLHWANRDQYYIKTAAHHPAAAFKIGGARFRFKIAEVRDIPRDNNKDSGRFLIPDIAAAAPDPNGDLVVPFAFCALGKEQKQIFAEIAKGENSANGGVQRGILVKAQDDLQKSAKQNPALRRLLKCDDDGGETAFMRHARRFVRRNNADFFIHRNLRKFLNDELDFFLKNEVLHVGELAGLGGFAVSARLVVFRAVRKLGRDIADKLAEWENLQKSLWEKKKFVLATEYCAALGHIPKGGNFMGAVAGRDEQWADWKKLGMLGEADGKLFGPGRRAERIKFLGRNQSLPVDTANFPPEFKDDLLAAFTGEDGVPGIDDATDGVLIHGENWQALNLMREMYRGRVKCVYIDPPYNSPSSEILYKNDFKHSSWLSMMENRVSSSAPLMAPDGALVCAVDENEMLRLGMLLDSIFPSPEFEKNCLTVVHNPKGIQGGFVSVNNEYAFVVSRAGQAANTLPIPESEWEWENFRNWGGESERETAKNCFYPVIVKGGKIVGFGDVCPDDFHPRQNEPGEDGRILVYPIDRDGVERKWTYARQSIPKIERLLRVVKKNGGVDIERTHDWRRFKTVWTGAQYIAGDYGTKPLNQILGGKNCFDFPKAIPLVMDCVRMAADDDSVVLDFFAGSGTTAHAVVNLNREDGGRRKFILAEAGDYFNTVLLPRVKKIMFAPGWRNGKPSSKATAAEWNRGPRLVKYQRIESYEDALANIRFDADADSAGLNLEGLIPRYELEWQSRNRPTRLTESGLESPFDYGLELVWGGGRAAQKARADLPETFSYFLGLRVRTRRVVWDGKRRYLSLRGRSRDGETAVIWRRTTGWKRSDFNRDRRFIEGSGLASGADAIYVNGDCCLPRAKSLNPLFGEMMFGPGGEEEKE